MIKAYSYIRMSSGRQLKGDSLVRQLGLSEAFAGLHNLDLDTGLRDLGVSAFDGSNRETGALAAFLQKVRAGEIERGSYLLVENLDRLSRDHVLKALRVFTDIIEAGIVLATVADGYIYSEETITKDWTQLIVSLAVMSRAHEESARKAGNLRQAWIRKRTNQNRKMTSRAPSWLTLSDDKQTFIENPDRVRLVIEILEDLASGIGRDKIARRLNARREPTWGGGREWHGGTVQKVTDSEAVIGRFQPHRMETSIVGGVKRQKRIPVGEPIEDYFPRIVSDDLWQRARASSDSRARSGPGNAGGRRGTVFSNLLSGLTRCASCGSPMNFRDRGSRSTVVLICSGSRNGVCENHARVPYPALERSVVDWAMFHEPAPAPVDEPAVEELAAAERRVGDLKAIIERLTVAI
ncbi:MAG: recombinase family protein, partial [Hyphomicrobiales bacterium]